MSQRFLNKTVLITGGTRGIGLAIAKNFAREGGHIAIFGKNPERGGQSLSEIKTLLKGDQKAQFYAVDMSVTTDVDKAMDQVYHDFGQIDILINNAGITKDSLLMKLKEEDWESVLNTNLTSIYRTCHKVVRPMMKSRQGKIINITSVVGLMGNAGQTNYAASKAGMIGFTKSLAKELGARGINVNCIAPGFIQTDMTDALTDQQKETISNLIPMGKLGDPQDIADTALFLASDQAKYITGQVIAVDGGMVM